MQATNKTATLQKELPDLPLTAVPRDGIIFYPQQPVWKWRTAQHTVNMDFNSLHNISCDLLSAVKGVLLWYATHRAADTTRHLFHRLEHYFRHVPRASGDALDSIRAVDLMNYRARLTPKTDWYLGLLSGFFRKWAGLGYSGIEEATLNLLEELRLRGNEKGRAVLTMDPETGPLTDIEFETTHVGLNNLFANGTISREDYVLGWIGLLIAPRPVQLCQLKVSDITDDVDADGIRSYILQVPRAKQRDAGPRSSFRARAMAPQMGIIIADHAKNIRLQFQGILEDPAQAPLFPSAGKSDFLQLPGYEYHAHREEIGLRLRSIFSRLGGKSERTGKDIRVTATRLRRTLGTRAAVEGHGELIIADLLDHSDTQNAGIYVEARPEIIKRIDRQLAMKLAPLAQAFAGRVVSGEHDAERGQDPGSRIADPRFSQSNSASGTCGKYGACGLPAPIACYTCRSFQPWIDGPHEAVLTHLLQERETLIKKGDKRVAAIHDRTILAVAQVVDICAREKQNKRAISDG